GMFPQSATYSSDSLGSSRAISARTERPPTPESNTPTGAEASTMLAPAHRATRIALDPQLAETRAQGIHQQQAPHQRLAESGEQFQRFQRLQAADQPDQRPDDASFAARQFRVAAVAVKTVIAGTIRAPWVKHRQLSFQTDRSAADQWLAGLDAGRVDRFTSAEVVGAIQHQVDCIHRCGKGVCVQRARMGDQPDIRIQRAQAGQR
ncbi:hypothetical protein COLO4_01522, partial [Corchorus olitorius]